MVYTQNFELRVLVLYCIEIIVKNITSNQRFKRWLLLRFILWCLWERIDTKSSSELQIFNINWKITWDIFYLEKKKRNIDTEWAYHSEFYFVVLFYNWGPGLNSCDSTFIFSFILYLICDIWTL